MCQIFKSHKIRSCINSHLPKYQDRQRTNTQSKREETKTSKLLLTSLIISFSIRFVLLLWQKIMNFNIFSLMFCHYFFRNYFQNISFFVDFYSIRFCCCYFIKYCSNWWPHLLMGTPPSKSKTVQTVITRIDFIFYFLFFVFNWLKNLVLCSNIVFLFCKYFFGYVHAYMFPCVCVCVRVSGYGCVLEGIFIVKA